MFKAGELAQIRSTGKIVKVIADVSIEPKKEWKILTSEGEFSESDLHPAHPTVLATIAASSTPWKRAGSDSLKKLLSGKVSFGLITKLEKLFKKYKPNLLGHWKGGKLFDYERYSSRIFFGARELSQKDIKNILSAAKKKVPLGRWISFDSDFGVITSQKCPCCGAGDFGVETNGIEIRIKGEKCPFEDGIPLTEWELNVPSGKLVVANDLRSIFPLPDEESFDIDGAFGCRQTSLEYAANGLSHAFVGNTCPGVFKLEKDSYKIANTPAEEFWNGKEYIEIKPRIPFEGEEVAQICTDLWWYSICDKEEFDRRCKRFKIDEKDLSAKVIAVKPGVYKFLHNEEARMENEDEADHFRKECIYTKFEWVRDPDPVKDYISAYNEADVHPHGYVQAMAKRWPTLYGKGKKAPWEDFSEEEKMRSWLGTANQLFCTIGGGVEWHEKGFPRAATAPKLRDIDPPHFRFQAGWYPFSKPYGGMFREDLSPSFAKFLFRVMESIVSFGMQVHDGSHSREVRETRKRMFEAVRRFRELIKKYPEQADPDYVRWLSQKGRAEEWVEKFPLGPDFTEKHIEGAKAQRWVPEDAYAIEFDSRLLKSGHFVHGNSWAHKENASAYAIPQWEDNGQEEGFNCFWSTNAKSKIPLWSVARVIKVGEVSHMGETLVELSFDYGNPWMQSTDRKAVREQQEKSAIRVLTKEEYEKLLPKAISFFENSQKKTK